MTEPLFNDPAFKAISYALDGLNLRQKVTTNNIANVDTPGYKAQQVKFEEQLQQAMRDHTEPGLPLKTTAAGHLGGDSSKTTLATVQQQNNTLRNDGNNVDIDIEMTNLAETTIRFQALSQMARMKFSLLKSIIKNTQ
jgi:flagellar basal-body rod protein FlgB